MALSYPNNGVQNVSPPTAIPATIAGGGNWNSGLLPAGPRNMVAACKLSQAGTITIQRYADLAGLVPIGALASTTLVANTANSVNIVDGVPCLSFVVVISNTSGSTGNLSGVAILTT